MKLIPIIIPIALVLSCSQQKTRTKASAEPPSFEVKTGTIAGAKLNLTKKPIPKAVKNNDQDFTGYYLPWPHFPIRAVKNRSTAVPNLHYGSLHIRTVDHKTKMVSFSNLAFGTRTEYTASFKMSSQTDPDGKKNPVIAAQTEQFSFQDSEHLIHFWSADETMKRMDKMKPYKYIPSRQPKLHFPDSHKVEMKLSAQSLPNASTDILKAEDIKNLTITDLKIMRMSIYARHGAAFKDHEMAEFFSEKDTSITNRMQAIRMFLNFGWICNAKHVQK